MKSIPLALLTTLTLLGCTGTQLQEPTPPKVVLNQNTSAQPKARGSESPGPAQLASSSPDLRVMTFNLRVSTIIDGLNHWNFRRDLLVRTIRDFDPDILGTQEALASQSDYLRAQFRDYTFVGAGRDDGARRGEMCGLYFRSSKFTQLDAGHFWLSETPTKPGSRSWGSAFTRMVTWVKLRPRDGSPDFCVFNTHFDVFASRARLQSARLLRARMDQIAPDMPAIITGDFNDSPESRTYTTLLAGTATEPCLVDTYHATNAHSPDTATRHGFSGSRSGDRIDWIISTPDFTPLAATIDRTRAGLRYPSDHFPVTAILRPSRASRTIAAIE